MEEIKKLCDLIEKVLCEHAEFYRAANARNSDENMVETVFDRDGNHYVLFNIAWEGYDRTHYAVVHLDIINGKIWIQKDETEEGVATDLEKYGVPKDKIVLAFKSPALRKYTEYAAA
ncbi:MAG: XisI protein [Acidobacteria bacterium]|nr:XisI protein [Acidobacteriota bacterium]